MVKVGEKKHLQFVMTLSCHRSNVFSPPPPTPIYAHTHLNTHIPDHVCGFEDERICGFSQDRSDVFDWTRQNHLTQNPKRSANTGPETDRSGTKEGEESEESFHVQVLFIAVISVATNLY